MNTLTTSMYLTPSVLRCNLKPVIPQRAATSPSPAAPPHHLSPSLSPLTPPSSSLQHHPTPLCQIQHHTMNTISTSISMYQQDTMNTLTTSLYLVPSVLRCNLNPMIPQPAIVSPPAVPPRHPHPAVPTNSVLFLSQHTITTLTISKNREQELLCLFTVGYLLLQFWYYLTLAFICTNFPV